MKPKTKKVLLGLGMALLGNFAYSQSGLEGIIVEKYYKANSADAASGTDPVPVNSVTYRVYVDLAPGYELQAIYGETGGGFNHVLRFQTSTSFFNNQDRGATTANAVPSNQLKNNTVAIDSWFSMGAAAAGQMGVLKASDNGAANLVHTGRTDGLLTNNVASIGIPLTTQDGMIAGTPEAVTLVGLSGAEEVFGTTGGSLFSTNNGSVASLNGAVGADADNRVLIGQFTTDGIFEFDLNLQVGLVAGGGVEKYVHTSPQAGEYTHASLRGIHGVGPTISMTSPSNGATAYTGDAITLSANANDADGTVTQVEFMVDGSVVNTDNAAPYTFNWPSTVGTHTISARATDNDGAVATTTLNPVVIVENNIAPIVSITAPANGTTYIIGDPIAIAANASDEDQAVDSVVFFRGATRLGVDVSSPYTFTTTATAGNHALTARAYDSRGTHTTSSAVNVSAGSNTLPTVSISAPTAGTSITAGPAVTLTITANAADSDPGQTVDSVEFFVDGVKVGRDLSSPFAFVWNVTAIPANIGTKALTAKATDSYGGTRTSAAVSIEVLDPAGAPYKIGTISQPCVASTFCLPISKVINPVANVIGYDMVLHYDAAKVQPSGGVTVKNNLINPAYATASYNVDAANEVVNISVSLNNLAPANTFFNGLGELVCVSFNKLGGFESVDTAEFSITNFTESYYTSVSTKLVDNGKYITYRDSTFNASLKFWADNSAIKYDALNPASYLVTEIFSNDTTCSNPSATSVKPDLNGAFTFNASNAENVTININRDIDAATSVQPVINGYDALLARKVLVNDPSFVPSVYQMIAMDVNQDGVISSGDVTQLNQRSVMIIPEFRQAWNYNAAGVSNGQPSKDWVFVDNTALTTDGSFLISYNFPFDDGVGYSKSRVPVVATCLAAPVADAASCPLITSETYYGIMLGDVNGNYKNISPDGTLRGASEDKIVLDLTNAVVTEQYIDVPVTFVSNSPVNALDLSLQLSQGISFSVVNAVAAGVEAMGNYNANNTTLFVTSNSMNEYAGSPVTLRFASENGEIATSDIQSSAGYLNGEAAAVEVKGNISVKDVEATATAVVGVYPNPAGEFFHILAVEDSKAELFDANGSLVLTTSVNANQVSTVNTTNIASGVYTLKVFSNNTLSITKVVIAK